MMYLLRDSVSSKHTVLKFERTRQTNKIILSIKQTNQCVWVCLFSDHSACNFRTEKAFVSGGGTGILSESG
jgi:mRNA deadenylase 3'-5' endonuclease subunit Ccr4